MTHEFKKIIQSYCRAKESGLAAVLATVVFLEGSSYRRPGVRMLITVDGAMTGAVSGGCVEKEVLRQSASVFETGTAKVITYDGRFRLGCEGILYILIEPFEPVQACLEAFEGCMTRRCSFNLTSYFSTAVVASTEFGTIIDFGENEKYAFSKNCTSPEKQTRSDVLTLHKKMAPCFKLIIIGAEHDAVQLCAYASLTGWDVTIVAALTDSKMVEHFPGAHCLINTLVESFNPKDIDSQTAVVLMTHNFSEDLKHLISLENTEPAYLGFLGPAKRREKIVQEFLIHCPDADYDFLSMIHGPAGLNIGAETPQEIAVSIVSEILAVTHAQNSISLKDKAGGIHSNSETK